ncbi:MAG: sigma-70 family RNA polymerase sigma factor [Thermodesulfobacteriota bacterium]|nr:sigma-70 family RNA polymerase sigma factor [Thermodesulfobacteriota bacterium]
MKIKTPGTNIPGRETLGRNTIDEQELVQRLKKGQQWAVNVLVDRYQNRLLKLAYGITMDMEDSQDVVQDVFVKAVKHIHGFRYKSSLWGWLRKITINACLNWKRKLKRRFKWHHQSLESENDPLLYKRTETILNPESILREKELNEKLMQAVKKLPEGNRVVFVLNTFEDLSYKEIAQTLNIRKGTVNSRLYHARKQIMAALNM